MTTSSGGHLYFHFCRYTCVLITWQDYEIKEFYYMKTIKPLIYLFTLIFLLVSGLCATVTPAKASGARISLTTEKTTLKPGEVFTVVVRVSSSDGVLTTDFYVDYNTSVLKFMSGGAKAVKEVGGVHIFNSDAGSSPVRRTYSLQFFAEKEGESSIFIRDGADVTDSDGQPLSLRTDRIEISITEEGSEEKPASTEKPVATPEPSLSGQNKVSELTTNAIFLSPDFSPDIKEYEATVDVDTDTFFIDYTLKSKKARATIKGNKNLTYGENEVKLVVTAENGKKRTYRFTVTRLNQTEDIDEPYEDKAQSVDTYPESPGALSADIPLDKESKNGYSIILYIVICLLMVFSISCIILIRRQKKQIDIYEEKMEEKNATEDDPGSRESDHEGGEIRGEDGESRYWY